MISTRRIPIRLKNKHMEIVVANLHADHKEISAIGQVGRMCITEKNGLGSMFFIDTHQGN